MGISDILITYGLGGIDNRELKLISRNTVYTCWICLSKHKVQSIKLCFSIKVLFSFWLCVSLYRSINRVYFMKIW